MGSVIFAAAARQWKQMRRDYQDYLEAQMRAAQEELGLNLLRRGSEASAESVFTGSVAHAERHASPELIEWWAHHGRMTVEEFERWWFEEER